MVPGVPQRLDTVARHVDDKLQPDASEAFVGFLFGLRQQADFIGTRAATHD